MTGLQSAALVLVLCSLGGYINQRTVRWPPVLAMTLLSLSVSLGMVALGAANLVDLDQAKLLIRSYDFGGLLLHGLLAFLLFAGALFVDVGSLRTWWRPIVSLITLGVVLSAGVVAVLLWLLSSAIGIDLPFLWCALFGALIAPTDPIAALSIVRRSGAPKHLEIKLVGESLFNDGTGVMLFLIVLGILEAGTLSLPVVAWEIFVAPLGAIGLGWVLGYIATTAIARVDHHPTEIMITAALASGVYGLAEAMHMSAPIAVVVAGLLVGHRARAETMSETTRAHLDSFWETADEILNTALFAMMGLELMLIDITPMLVVMGVSAWAIVVLGRTVGVVGALSWTAPSWGTSTASILAWGGLRGGISLALALSLPKDPHASVLVAMTFIVVALSAILQGLTLPRLIRHFFP